MTTALLDRLTHRCHILETGNDSFRFRASTETARSKKEASCQAKTANEVLKSQERRLKLMTLKGELVDRARAEALVFRLARETRDTWLNWPARAAALIAAELSIDPAAMQKVLEAHVRAHLGELGQRDRLDLG